MAAYITCFRRRAFYPCSMTAFADEQLWVRGALMVNLLEIAGRKTLIQLDYVGSLNIQLWEYLARDARGFAPGWKSTSLACNCSPNVTDRRRGDPDGGPHGNVLRLHPRHAGSSSCGGWRMTS